MHELPEDDLEQKISRIVKKEMAEIANTHTKAHPNGKGQCLLCHPEWSSHAEAMLYADSDIPWRARKNEQGKWSPPPRDHQLVRSALQCALRTDCRSLILL